MNGLLDGKVAVITGAGSGVGRAAAILFARHGARVVAADVDIAAADQTAEMARKSGGSAVAVACDVTDPASLDAAVARAVADNGCLDIMFNNAGITFSVPGVRGVPYLTQTSRDNYQRISAVNIEGVIFGCQSAIRQFEAQGGGGAIVNTASVSGLIGYGGAAYGATKGAVTALTRSLAIEVAPMGIRVNSVCPAGMLTHFSGMDPDGEHAEAIAASMSRSHPLGKPIDPMDCAKGALFLASDLASNVTGVNLPIDGGLCAGVSVRKQA